MNNNNDLMIKQSRGGGGGPPCGACKFLRRKCVMGCVFAPYFDSDHGAAHFAAVHKVFGASNASKLLLRLPPHKRLDAVVTLCYEALARVRDPIYGCVAHIFTLQQQVVNLQAELAIVQSRLSTLQLQCVPSSMSSTGYLPSAYEPTSLLVVPSSPRCAMNVESDRLLVQPLHHGPVDTVDDVLDQMDDQEIDDAQLQAVARDFVARYLTGVKLGSLHSRKNI